MDPTVLAFPAITRLHRSRTSAIHRLLTPGSEPKAHRNDTETAFGFAVAHHLLEGAEAAARAGDSTRFAWYTEDPSTAVTRLRGAAAASAPIVLAPDVANMARSELSDTPYVLVGPDSSAAEANLGRLVTGAFQTAGTAGMGHLVELHAPIVCLLRRKRLGATFDSWTTTRLPGTVFTDYADEPSVLARDLVHEAGHNWLNDALAATATKVDDSVEFYSPWKDRLRPAFGFLHACWAFPLAMIYTARILHHINDHERSFLAAYLDQQRALLARTVTDHKRALRLIKDDELRERLRTVHRMALAA